LKGRGDEEEYVSGNWMAFKEKIRYWKLKKGAFRTCFGGGYGHVVKQTTWL